MKNGKFCPDLKPIKQEKKHFCRDKSCKKEFVKLNPMQPYCFECTLKRAKEATKKKFKADEKKNDAKVKIEVYKKENTKLLQDEINRLSKMIDIKFGHDACIDCGKFMDRDKNQIDSCHLISRKKNVTLKFHLDNLHSGHNHCNVYNENHETNYKAGIVKRYGQEYLNEIEALPLKYPEIHLTAQDIAEKLKLVRKLIRDFNSFDFTGSLQARKQLNKLIAIYD